MHTLHSLKPPGKLQPHTFPMKPARTSPPSTSAAAGASAEFSAPSPSVGSKRPRSPGALADLSQAAMPNKRLRLSASDGSLSAGPEVKAPALQTLIGTERAADLDVRFGSLQPVRTKDGDGIHDWEKDAEGRPLAHPRFIALQGGDAPPDWTDPAVRKAFDIDALKAGDKQYIWAASALGRVFIGEEEPVGHDPDSGKQRRRGHPLLVSGGPARICGEFRFDAETGKLVVINKSGRYSRYEDRREAQLQEVATIIRAAVAPLGLEVETEYRSGKTPDALVLPSLDPKYREPPAD
ncbi:type III effector protein [Ralstonia nicotianae]